MGPRITISVFILALSAVVLAYYVGHNTSPAKGTYIAVSSPSVPCQNLSSVYKELQSQHFTVDRGDGKKVTVTGLVFTTCVDPELYVTPQTLDMVYENVKERLYRTNDASAFTTAIEVKTEAATAAHDLIQTFPSYKGRIVVYVGTQPETAERISLVKDDPK